MNIQTLLSALPTTPTGKPEAGAAAGHFALALSQAAGASQADGNALPAPLTATAREGLPSTMAAQQALLQALNAHSATGQQGQFDGEALLAQPNAQLEEIMARLALIEANPLHESPEPLEVDLAALPAQLQEAFKAASVESQLAEQPQAAALAASAQATTTLADAQRLPGTAASGSTGRSDLPASVMVNAPHGPGTAQLHGPALPAATLTASAPAQAQPGLAPSYQAATLDTAMITTPVRAADAASNTASVAEAIAKASASQPNGTELRSVATDGRGGFVPEAASLAPPTASNAAALSPASASPALLTQASLPAPVQSPAWPGQLGQQLVQFARRGGEQQIEMRLNPAELGPLSVTLKMTEQGAQAQFLAAHAQVRQVLEQAIPQLREALAEQGISLGETSVGEQRQDAQAFAGHDEQGGQGGTGRGDGELMAGTDSDDGIAELATSTLTLDGRVNLYA